MRSRAPNAHALLARAQDYSEHHATTYHFPDAYAGQNTKIRDTLNNLILKSPQNWQTSVGLPFFPIEGTVVEWCVPHAPTLSTAQP